MALLASCTDAVFDCEPGEWADYHLIIPGDEFRLLEVTPEDSEVSGSDGGGSEADSEAARAEREAEVEALLEKDELKEKFEEASGGSETISAAKAADFARGMGFAPSEEDVKWLDERTGDQVNFEETKKFFADSAHPEDTAEHLLEVFRHYDPQNTGKLSKKQIKNLLQNFGEPMTDAEVESLFKTTASSDPVAYEGLVEKILEKKE